jgi:hypothetical protein
MTKLTKEDFDLGFGSERYIMYGPNRTFIARFKHGRAAACANHYVKQMIKLLTKEELEEAIVACLPGRAPASEAMDARGYIHYNIIQAAKAMGVSPAALKANPTMILKKAA